MNENINDEKECSVILSKKSYGRKKEIIMENINDSKYEGLIRRMGWWTMILGIANAVFYLLHDVIGAMNYPGYDWMKQAVSDLTAEDSPAREIAEVFTGLYGKCAIITCVLLCVMVKYVRKPLRVGIYLFAGMNAVSNVGYGIFPLTGKGYDGTFQSFMHVYVITAAVVLLSIVSLIVIAVGSFKDKRKKLGVLAMVALGCMFLGAAGSGAVPKSIFGIFERFSTYSAVVFTAVLGVYWRVNFDGENKH